MVGRPPFMNFGVALPPLLRGGGGGGGGSGGGGGGSDERDGAPLISAAPAIAYIAACRRATTWLPRVSRLYGSIGSTAWRWESSRRHDPGKDAKLGVPHSERRASARSARRVATRSSKLGALVLFDSKGLPAERMAFTALLQRPMPATSLSSAAAQYRRCIAMVLRASESSLCRLREIMWLNGSSASSCVISRSK